MSLRPHEGKDRSRSSFDALYEQHQRAILAYALRRSDTVQDAEEVAAETFVVAWRRLGSQPDEVLPWLYAIARRVLANHRRSADRRLALLARLRTQPMDVATRSLSDSDGPSLQALRRLRPSDQELLRLVAWEGLGHSEIGVVLGITANAVAIRLYRARGRFTEAFAQASLKEPANSWTSGQVQGRPSGRLPTEDSVTADMPTSL